jgi:hypothetical protein
MFTLYTFGDSILDCGHYNEHGATPGGLIVRNDDELFPEFRGRDLCSRGPARLIHRAVDGSLASEIAGQSADLPAPDGLAAALVTIGGNDLLVELFYETEPDIDAFTRTVSEFIAALPVRPVFLGNVYDPTFGDDARNFLGIAPSLARAGLAALNAAIARVAAGVEGGQGRLVDLHAHFLTGDPSWFVNTIEPSLTGASEIRRVFVHALLDELFDPK